MTDSDRKIALEMKRRLAESGVQTHQVVVFGSRARGDAGPDSDLDLLIAVDEETPLVRDVIEDCAWDVGYENDIYVQPVIKERKDIEEGPERSSLFMMAVREEGIPV